MLQFQVLGHNYDLASQFQFLIFVIILVYLSYDLVSHNGEYLSYNYEFLRHT